MKTMSRSAQTALNPLAVELNEKLESAASPVLDMLSAYGRRLYFPKGILSQSAEAKEKAHQFNATIGIATQGGGPMYLPSVHAHLKGIEPADAYTYASAAGRAGLRERWRDKLVEENPDLAGRSFGLPIVTAAITHGLSLASELFVDEGDRVVIPDKLWGNYRMNLEVHRGAEIRNFPFYAGTGFNVEGFANALAQASRGREKLIVLLNFPNNPTGYMPSVAESEALESALVAQAQAGTRLVVIADDAYFGLFYHIGGVSSTQSLFARLTGRHPNLLAVKLDGATKEFFAWGLRCGFITFGPGTAETAEEVCSILEAKTKGAIRGGVSNVGQLSQSLIESALGAPTLEAERGEKNAELRARAERVAEVAALPRYAESWDIYPFNSGYFMCVRVKGVDAEKLRVHLLAEYGVGLISTSASDIRIAFSCLEVDQVEPLFELLHRAVQDLV
jgi:aspartate/methionine/tyrosine aminotransferase